MKVLMLGWELPPHNSGGLGVACLQMCKALARSGADIDFVLPYRQSGQNYPFMRVQSASPRATSADLFIQAYDSLGVGDDLDTILGSQDQHSTYSDRVAALAKSIDFDIIHAHDWLTFRAALRAKEVSGKPLVAHVHSIERDRAGGEPGNPLVREIEATTMLLADRVIAVSQRTAQMIAEDYHIPESKIEVVHNSIDPDSLVPLEGANAYKYLEQMKCHGWKVVVNVGRLTIQKGLTNLLCAAAEVVKRQPKTYFLFVGDGEQRDELLEMAAGLGIADRTLFAGFQRGKNWRDAYGVADLFVMPSVSEPFGLTPLEAMGYGVPVLVSRQSGMTEIVRSCLKADFWDINQMANQMTAALQNNSLHDSLQDNGYSEYNNLNWSRAADKLMGIYQSHQQGVPA
jgi:glycosyltransferase involved in cell wall biosynthesis